MTDEEFREKYGRDPVKPGQHTKVKVYWDRIIIALILLVAGTWMMTLMDDFFKMIFDRIANL